MGKIGTILRGRYEIITELGKGGMSTVYLAKDLNLDSYWAVKQVNYTSQVDMDCFKKEVELLACLNHAYIPRIVDRIEIQRDYYVIMDFVDGTSLGRKVQAEGPLKEKEVVEMAKMLCEVLDYLHNARQNPIVYRDMKPDNVMLTQSGKIKLIDFGIAKECVRGQVEQGANIGTKGYAAPEQYRGTSNILDERTDIYSLGATLYYLVTGIVPGKPPNAIKSVRQIDSSLSEGLEYIILKCANDDPEKRYQNCKELNNDLENIDKLTSTYRGVMRKKLMAFVACIFFSIVFGICSYLGYRDLQYERLDKYDEAFKEATAYERQEDYENAAKAYSDAIEHKPSDIDTYIKLFNVLLPYPTEDDYIEKTKSAIDEIRIRYLDNKKSAMYKDSRLMYQVVKKCVEINDPSYCLYAVDYIEDIKNSSEYKNGTISEDEIHVYEIVATNSSKNISTFDFISFQEALDRLEEYTDEEVTTANERLDNYYLLIKIYSTYPANLNNAYDKIYEIGTKAKEVIDSNIQSDDLTFNSVIPMYELVASSLYNSTINISDDEEKEETYFLSLEWVEYIEDLNQELSDALVQKKANTYKGLFDLYNTDENKHLIDNRVSGYLDSAIEIYRSIVDKKNNDLLANVQLAQAYLDKELLKEEGQRNFTNVKSAYERAERISNENVEQSITALSQFSSLKKQIENLE